MNSSGLNSNNELNQFKHNESEQSAKIYESEIPIEIVKRIENSKMNLDDKINLLLTKGGLKPASALSLIIKTWKEEYVIENMSEEDVLEVLDIIKSLKIPFVTYERKVVKEFYRYANEPEVERYFLRERMDILVARTQQELDFLKQALKSDSHEMLGKAFGFPQTAIEAFVGKRKKLNRQSLPLEIRNSDGFLFLTPTLSEDNWQEEIKQGEAYAEFIKKISPKLYEEWRLIALKSYL